MGKIEFTKEQKKAIETRDKNILVSAAAGSGKTAILVERIIRRVTDKKDPVDIDRILVMTFTRAAAEQMREKILNAIEDKRKEDPFNTHLQKQEALIYTAHISTIHGFCLDVLKNHFNESGIDPDFRVADEGETKLLKADVMEEILEEAYEKGDENFITLSESVASGKNDKALEDTIMDVTKYSMSYPEPEEWLEKCVNTYENFATGDISNNKNLKWLHEEIRKKIEDIKKISESLIKFIRDSATLESYEPTIEADISMYAGLLEKTSYFDLITELQKIKYVTLGYDKNGKKVKCEIKPDKDEKTYVQETRKKCKDFLDKIINNINGYDEEKEKEHVKHTEPNVRTLCDLVRAFMDRYREKKEEAHILDYNDLEHLAIKVFKGNDGAIAAEYRDLFEEIYVDEYQDSNLVQEELINLISRKNNVFMVGDVKQSIYGFRLTRPEMFMEKYEKYQNDESSADTVIDLKHNFRSRPEVLDSVNEVFGSVMHKENADIEYDDKQKLIFGMKAYEELPSDNDRTELILINRDEEIGKTELEAEVIAERIKTLMREMKVFDSDDKNGRALRYSDIALLLRSTRGSGIYKRILEKNAIPVHVMNDEGYFEAKEVAILLDYLKIIDNPLQDIPLAAVLKSWFCKMRDNEMAAIRSRYPKDTLYASLKKALEENEAADNAIFNTALIKTRDFITKLEQYREKMGYTSVYDLLEEILGDGYMDHLASLENGEKKTANMEMLLRKAEDYAKTSYKGLFQFVRYIDKLKKYEVDYGEANLSDEKDNTVRIMTIHKSKGLEFPVCIIANIEKKYNETDISANHIMDMDIGIGMDNVDLEKRIRTKTIVKDIIRHKKLKDLRSEELRVLYVAMTRAREKLIMTAVCRDVEKELEKARYLWNLGSYLDVLLYSAKVSGFEHTDIITTSIEDIVTGKVRHELVKDEARNRLKYIAQNAGKEEPAKNGDNKYEKELIDRFGFVYQRSQSAGLYEKHSVTELKKKQLEEALRESDDSSLEPYEELFAAADETEEKKLIPQFMKDKTDVPANVHGTAVHRIFEIWDYNNGTDKASIKAFIKKATEEGLIDKVSAGSVSDIEISGFVNSDLSKRMKEAYLKDLLFREQPFVVELDGQLIQGIIDAYFIEDDGIVVVDYKTDRVNSEDTLVERYSLQLDYYSRTLERILNRPVKEKLIYSTVLGKSVTVK